MKPFVARRLAASLLLYALLGCAELDPYAEKFPGIAIGDTRASVLERLGPPSSTATLELPLLRVEQLGWRAPARGQLYFVFVAFDHVVAKSTTH